jgi:hypothetical protein
MNAYRIFVGKAAEKKLLDRRRHRWVEIIKTDLRDIGWGVMQWIDLAQD